MGVCVCEVPWQSAIFSSLSFITMLLTLGRHREKAEPWSSNYINKPWHSTWNETKGIMTITKQTWLFHNNISNLLELFQGIKLMPGFLDHSNWRLVSLQVISFRGLGVSCPASHTIDLTMLLLFISCSRLNTVEWELKCRSSRCKGENCRDVHWEIGKSDYYVDYLNFKQ